MRNSIAQPLIQYFLTAKKLSIAILLILIALPAHSQGFLRADGKYIVDGEGNRIILRGMGLGGWMLQEGYMLRVHGIGQQQHVIRANIEALIGKERTEEFYDSWLANHTREIDIDSMAAWGFNSVRLAMHYNLFTLPVEEEPVLGENTWLERGFVMTDSLLKWCAKNNMYLILDLHAAPGGQGNDLNISDRDPSKPSLWESEANQKKTIALWRKLAERYANDPWLGAYDVINEPNWGFSQEDDKNGCNEEHNTPLKKLLVDIISAIREVDRNHIVIIEGNCWGNNYSGILPPWDDNTVISFHKYWNFNDEASIRKFLDIREQYNTPVWLGESGENSNVWFRDAIHLVESHDIGWAWWPLKKLGFNNPLEVKVPDDYQKILDYWRDEGEKPSVDIASNGLMELADNVKLENCIFHKDVIDAMFRQTRTDETLPFTDHHLQRGLTILAADYDLGRNGFAYFDNDTANYWVSGVRSEGNKGRVYRNDGVDILPPQRDNRLHIVTLETGEWLQYTMTSDTDNNYNVSLLFSSTAPGKIGFELNGKLHVLDIPDTRDTWQMVRKDELTFMQGKNIVRVKAVEGDVGFQAILIR